MILNAATYNTRFVAGADTPKPARRYRSQQMRLALLQSRVHLAGLQETMFKRGTCKADGYWMVSAGAQGKKYCVTLAISAVEPCATAAGRDLCLQPKHVYVLNMGNNIRIARIRAPLLAVPGRRWSCALRRHTHRNEADSPNGQGFKVQGQGRGFHGQG